MLGLNTFSPLAKSAGGGSLAQYDGRELSFHKMLMLLHPMHPDGTPSQLSMNSVCPMVPEKEPPAEGKPPETSTP
jgi:hypothetical protein